jgi:hypothetical protein
LTAWPCFPNLTAFSIGPLCSSPYSPFFEGRGTSQGEPTGSDPASPTATTRAIIQFLAKPSSSNPPSRDGREAGTLEYLLSLEELQVQAGPDNRFKVFFWTTGLSSNPNFEQRPYIIDIRLSHHHTQMHIPGGPPALRSPWCSFPKYRWVVEQCAENGLVAR